MNILGKVLFAASLLLIPLWGCKPTATPPPEEQQKMASAEFDHAPHADAHDDHHEHHTHDEHHVHDEDHAHDEHHEDHAHATPGKGIADLKLNNGQKWAMDTHTRELIQQMHETTAKATISSPKDGQKIGATLDHQLHTLMQGCTMTGPAHDQLHLFLSEFMPAVSALKATESNDEAQEKIDRLKAMLMTYDEHFE